MEINEIKNRKAKSIFFEKLIKLTHTSKTEKEKLEKTNYILNINNEKGDITTYPADI